MRRNVGFLGSFTSRGTLLVKMCSEKLGSELIIDLLHFFLILSCLGFEIMGFVMMR